MREFILLMYNDATNLNLASDDQAWGDYLASLRASGHFDGGSSISSGLKLKKGFADCPSSAGLNGFIRIRAEGFEAARKFLEGNPVYEAGGTVEVLELLKSD